jgi:hypothetical protein
MIIANLNEMLKHDLGVEYEYKDHKWINQQLTCSCIIAICIDIDPAKNDCDQISKLFTKQNTLLSLIKETAHSDNEEIKNKFDQFCKELEDTKFQMKQFVHEKRIEFKFPVETDFNSEYYFLKIKKGNECNN